MDSVTDSIEVICQDERNTTMLCTHSPTSLLVQFFSFFPLFAVIVIAIVLGQSTNVHPTVIHVQGCRGL